MLAKTVTISGKYDPWPIEKDLLASHRCNMRKIETQVVSSSYVSYFAPLALLGFLAVDLKDCSNSKSECCFRHEIGNDTFVGFASVNQSKLLNPLNLHSNSVFENILYLLTENFVAGENLLLKVCWMGPSNLDCGSRLCYMSKLTNF
jgi:hypothetical protein